VSNFFKEKKKEDADDDGFVKKCS